MICPIDCPHYHQGNFCDIGNEEVCDLKDEIKKLTQQIILMKNCENCEHMDKNGWKNGYWCPSCIREKKDGILSHGTKSLDNWQLKEVEL